MTAAPHYYVGSISSTDLTTVSGFTSAIEAAIAAATNSSTKKATIIINAVARTSVAAPVVAQAIEITINADTETITGLNFASDVIAGLVIAEVSTAVASAIVAAAAGAATAPPLALIGVTAVVAGTLSTVYSAFLEPTVDSIIDELLGTVDRDFQLLDGSGNQIGGVLYKDGLGTTTEPQAIRELFVEVVSGNFGSNVSLVEGMQVRALEGQAGQQTALYTIADGTPFETIAAFTGDSLGTFLARSSHNAAEGQLVANSDRYFASGNDKWLFLKDTDKITVNVQSLGFSPNIVAFAPNAIVIGAETLFGSVDLVADRLFIGDGGSFTYVSGSGDDFILGGSGTDELHGGAGDDYIAAHGKRFTEGSEDDNLFGDDGNDILIGSDGSNQLFGGTGKDVLVAHRGQDRLTGGEGTDFLIGSAAPNTFATEEDIAEYFGTRGITIDLSINTIDPDTLLPQDMGNITSYEKSRIIQVTDDGGTSPSKDFLYLMDIIVGTSVGDRIVIPNLSVNDLRTQFEGLKFIDLASAPANDPTGPGDEVDASAITQDLIVDLSDAANQFIALRDDTDVRLNLKNVNVVHLGGGSDLFAGGGKFDGKLTHVFLGDGRRPHRSRHRECRGTRGGVRGWGRDRQDLKPRRGRQARPGSCPVPAQGLASSYGRSSLGTRDIVGTERCARDGTVMPVDKSIFCHEIITYESARTCHS